MTFRMVFTPVMINERLQVMRVEEYVCEICDQPITDHLELEIVPFCFEGDDEPFEYKHAHRACLETLPKVET